MNVSEQLKTKTQGPSAGKRLVCFVLIIALAVVISVVTPIRDFLSVDELRGRLKDLGAMAPAAILIIGALGPSLLLPRWPVAFASGFLYGVGWGSILGNIASSLGALVHFFMAVHLLAPSTEKLCAKRGIDIQRIPRDKAFLVIFLLRAFPFSSTVVTNIVAGGLRVNVGTYFAATFLGMIPSTLIYAASGTLMHEPSPAIYIAITAGICIFAVVGWVGRGTIRSFTGKAKAQDNGAESSTGSG